MSEPPHPAGDRPGISMPRIAVWIIVGAISVYLLATGIAGIIVKS